MPFLSHLSRGLAVASLVALANAGALAGEAPVLTIVDPAKADAADAEMQRQASYLVGQQFGGNLAEAVKEYDLDLEQLIQGLRDAVAGKPSPIPPDQAKQIMDRFQATHQAKAKIKEEQRGLEGAKRKETNPAWLAENAKKPGIKSTASGLQYEVLEAGSGRPVKLGDKVVVNYKGMLLDGTVFDASEKHGGPATFPVEDGGLIKGWIEALQMMKEGDKWKLYIPAELAYGEQAPPSIGPNQILVFEIGVEKVLPAGPAEGLTIPK